MLPTSMRVAENDSELVLCSFMETFPLNATLALDAELLLSTQNGLGKNGILQF